MLPLVTELAHSLPEFFLSLPEFSRFLKIFLGGDTPPHTPSSDAPDSDLQCSSYLSNYAVLFWRSTTSPVDGREIMAFDFDFVHAYFYCKIMYIYL